MTALLARTVSNRVREHTEVRIRHNQNPLHTHKHAHAHNHPSNPPQYLNGKGLSDSRAWTSVHTTRPATLPTLSKPRRNQPRLSYSNALRHAATQSVTTPSVQVHDTPLPSHTYTYTAGQARSSTTAPVRPPTLAHTHNTHSTLHAHTPSLLLSPPVALVTTCCLPPWQTDWRCLGVPDLHNLSDYPAQHMGHSVSPDGSLN